MKNENISCVPKVRFPGFEEPWKVVRLGDIAEHRHEKNTDGRVNRVLTNSAEYGIVDQTAYFEGQIANSKNIDRYIIVEQFDFVYNPRVSSTAPVGPISVNKLGKGIMSPIYLAFHFVQDVESSFYEYFFQTESWHKYLRTKADTGARFDRLNISSSAFFDMPIPLPSLDEQQKIASCLSSIDDVIKETEEKVESLKKHKLGLMQKMFPNRENVKKKVICGNKNDVPEWTFHKIGDISTSFSGGTPKTSNPEFYGGQIPFIRSSEIHSEKTVLFLTEDGLRNSSAKMVSKGDILLAMYGANSGDIAVSKMDGSINQAILCLRVNCDKMFFVHFFTFIKQQILSSMLQGGQGNLSADIIKNIVIPLCSPSGQKHIASCLSSIDDIITAYKEKLTLLKLHKKGLIQLLFPQIIF